MRRYLFVFILLLLQAQSTAAIFSTTERRPLDPTASDLWTLYEEDDYFLLRKKLNALPEESLESLYFRALTEAAFYRLESSNALIRRALAGQHLTDSARLKLFQTRMSNLFRLYRYSEALRVARTILDQTWPETSSEELEDVVNFAKILRVLEDVPPMEVSAKGESLLSYAGPSPRVPARFGSATGEYILDTGANLSVLMESEAERLGLEIRPADIQVGTITDLEVTADIAVAGELIIGQHHFQNVVFLVFPDPLLTFGEGKHKIPGILGFNVIQAFGEVHFRPDSIFVPQMPTDRGLENLALDGLDPRIQIFFRNSSLVCRLDTGAGDSDFYTPFFELHRDWVESHGELAERRSTGVGGTRHFSTYEVPSLEIRVADKMIRLSNVDVYPKPIRDSHEKLDCNLGLDALSQFEEYIINFHDLSFLLGAPLQLKVDRR